MIFRGKQPLVSMVVVVVKAADDCACGSIWVATESERYQSSQRMVLETKDDDGYGLDGCLACVDAITAGVSQRLHKAASGRPQDPGKLTRVIEETSTGYLIEGQLSDECLERRGRDGPASEGWSWTLGV